MVYTTWWSPNEGWALNRVVVAINVDDGGARQHYMLVVVLLALHILAGKYRWCQQGRGTVQHTGSINAHCTVRQVAH